MGRITLTLGELALALNATLSDKQAKDVLIDNVCGLEEAKSGSLIFVETAHLLEKALAGASSAILVPHSLARTVVDRPTLAVPNPKLSFAKALELYFPKIQYAPGIHHLAWVSESAHVSPSASVGPFTTIAAGVTVKEDVTIEAFCVVGPNCTLERGSHLRPRVRLSGNVSIGPRAIIHSGSVVGAGTEIMNDVEIGAKSTVGNLPGLTTRIASGSKIDNQVYIGAGATIGEHCLLVGQSSVEHNSVLAAYAVLAGQSLVKAGVTVGSGSISAGRTVVQDNVAQRTTVSGSPGRQHRENLRLQGYLHKLLQMQQSLIGLEKAAAGMGE